MTWSEFLTAVRVHLPAHGRRQGIQTLIDTLVKAGAWDLQASVQFYQAPTTRTFKPESLRENGYAATGTLPAASRVVSVYNREASEDVRYPYEIVTTDEGLSQMVQGLVGQSPRQFHYNPVSGAFTVTPNTKDDTSWVVIAFKSIKTDYETSDDVPFDEKAAEAVGYFVQSRLALQVDRDANLAQTYNGLYVATKRKLRSELNPSLLTPAQAKEA